MFAIKSQQSSLNKADATSKIDINLTIDKSHLLTNLESYERSEQLIDEWTRGIKQFRKLYYEDCFINGELSDHLKIIIKNYLNLNITKDMSPLT
jgi:hypothetical protein